MKKLCCLLLTLCFLMGMVSMAQAATWGPTCGNCIQSGDRRGRINFGPIDLQSYNDTELRFLRTVNSCYCLKSVGTELHVSHTVQVGSSAYTNKFHAVRRGVAGDYTSGSLVGYKWAAPVGGNGIPISGISKGYYYNVKARGNTNHSMYDGLNTITITGSYAVNVDY